MACRVCGCDAGEVVYHGPLRTGRFGSATPCEYDLVKCAECGVVSLPEDAAALCADYETGEYRAAVDGSADPAAFLTAHAAEQPGNIAAAGGIEAISGKRVVDVGAGAGAFLLAVREAAAEVVGVEPDATMRANLAASGIEAYPYGADALAVRPAAFDLAVSFATLEHVSDPAGFVAEIRGLVAPGGRVVITTPNADDALLELAGRSYHEFMHRTAHLTYFDASALAGLLERAGFSAVRVRGYQRFGLGNALGWIRNGRPQGELAFSAVSREMDACWRSELERTLRSDFLIAEARVTG